MYQSNDSGNLIIDGVIMIRATVRNQTERTYPPSQRPATDWIQRRII